MMVRSFGSWMATQPHATWTAPALNQFLGEKDYKPSYHNRLGTEVKRFGEHVLGEELNFIRALKPLGPGSGQGPGRRMPKEHARRLMDRLWKSIELDIKRPAPLDVELAFMAQFGCRPCEAAKLLDPGRSTLERLAKKQFQQLWT